MGLFRRRKQKNTTTGSIELGDKLNKWIKKINFGTISELDTQEKTWTENLFGKKNKRLK